MDTTATDIDAVIRNNGVLTILWHNNEMQGDSLKLYQNILAYCSEKNAWMTSGEEICSFFSACNY
jgi:peptidoglycan/xylan/chitin deacetylase (PgdA/CDA1 family)